MRGHFSRGPPRYDARFMEMRGPPRPRFDIRPTNQYQQQQYPAPLPFNPNLPPPPFVTRGPPPQGGVQHGLHHSGESFPQNQYYPVPSSNMPPGVHHFTHIPSMETKFAKSHYTENLPHSDVRGTDAQSSSVDQETLGVKSDSDVAWINNWLSERNIKTDSLFGSISGKYTVSISVARQIFKSFIRTLNEIEMEKNKLKTLMETDQDKWHAQIGKIHILQKTLLDIKNKLSPKDIQFLSKKRKCIMKKRSHIKNAKERNFEAKIDQMRKRARLHEEIDAWQDGLLQKELKIKREKDLKAAADATMSEVRMKQNEAKKCIAILEKLTKLRKVRKTALEQTGLYTQQDTEEAFESGHTKLNELMEKQLITYRSEEKALEVMLEAEVEESEEKLKEEQESNRKKRQAKQKTQLKTLLFGNNVTPDSNSEVYPYWQYHTAADSSLQTLLMVRQDWDRFLVQKGNQGGSSINPGWVTPAQPSSEAWKSALKS